MSQTRSPPEFTVAIDLFTDMAAILNKSISKSIMECPGSKDSKACVNEHGANSTLVVYLRGQIPGAMKANRNRSGKNNNSSRYEDGFC